MGSYRRCGDWDERGTVASRRSQSSGERSAYLIVCGVHQDDLLDLQGRDGVKRFIETRLLRNVTIREENSIAALEVMTKFLERRL